MKTEEVTNLFSIEHNQQNSHQGHMECLEQSLARGQHDIDNSFYSLLLLLPLLLYINLFCITRK